jgi:hypothetical protein
MSNECTVCKGSKVRVSEAFTSLEGKVYPRTEYKCVSCDGHGAFEPVNEDAIIAAITATRGKNKGKLRAAFTSPTSKEGHEAARAYYVWRIARFHGGADVTLPIMAEMVVRGDPFRAELDAIADKVAEAAFGSKYRAAARWGRALGMI